MSSNTRFVGGVRGLTPSGASQPPKFSLTPTGLVKNILLTPLWFYHKSSNRVLVSSGYLRFQKGGPNFRWPLVLTQRGPNHVFLFFRMVKIFFICQAGHGRGPWPNGPPEYATVGSKMCTRLSYLNLVHHHRMNISESEGLQCFNCRGITNYDPNECFNPVSGKTVMQECAKNEFCEVTFSRHLVSFCIEK